MMMKPGDEVTIQRVDTEGLWGRIPHPPVDRYEDRVANSPCDGKKAYVVAYSGWEGNDGAFLTTDHERQRWVGEYVDTPLSQLTPDEVYSQAPPDATHYWLLVVPGQGVFPFADYELTDPVANQSA